MYATEVCWTYSRRYGAHWSVEAAPKQTSPGEWWPAVARLASGRRHVLIVAPIGTHFLTMTSFWAAVDSGLFAILDRSTGTVSRGKMAGAAKRPWLGRCVLKGTPTILSAKTPSGSITVVSASNYAPLLPADVCRSTGVRVEPPADLGDTAEDWGPTDEAYCLALTRWFRRVIADWHTAAVGPWADTAGGLGVSLWRGLDGRRAVRRHTDEDAAEIEAGAMHGGRAAVWFYGSVGDRSACPPPPADPPPEGSYPNLTGKAHKLDVRSMYPWILGAELFPVALKAVRWGISVEKLAGLTRYQGGIADVTIESQSGEYPYRDGRRIRYPVGRFRTTLAGAELERAIRDREVVECHALCRYELGRPFVRWSDRVLRERMNAKAQRDPCGELFWKVLSNSFGGKFAQRRRRWVACPRELPERRWGEYLLKTVDGEVPERRRALCGIPFRLLTGGAGSRLPAAVYAYLTAYGRMYMRGIRSALGSRCVLSQDTDGVWVTDEGLARARRIGLLDHDTPGSLRHECSASYARWWDAKHYYRDGEWTAAGVASGWTLTRTGTALERRRVEPTEGYGSPDEGQLVELVTSRRLDSIQPDVPVGPDGWARPCDPSGKSLDPAPRVRPDPGDDGTPPPKPRKRPRKAGPSLLDLTS